MYIKRFATGTAALLLTGIAFAHPAEAQTNWRYRTFSGPDSLAFYQPNDINNAGTIVGSFRGQTTGGGFVENGGNFTQFGNRNTSLSKINNSGISVGDMISDDGSSDVAYVRASNGTISNLPMQSSNDTALGLNDVGKVVGYSINDSFDTVHGIVWNGIHATTFDHSNTSDTSLWGVNNAGKIVGNTEAIFGSANFMGFVLENGIATSLSIPGAAAVFAADINNRDQILGQYATADGSSHGFLLKNGVVTTLDFNGIDTVFAPTYTDSNGHVFTRTGTFTDPNGLNDHGDFVGLFGAFYQSVDGHGSLFVERGFVATAVPEPGAVALFVGMAVCGTGLLRRRYGQKARAK